MSESIENVGEKDIQGKLNELRSNANTATTREKLEETLSELGKINAQIILNSVKNPSLTNEIADIENLVYTKLLRFNPNL